MLVNTPDTFDYMSALGGTTPAPRPTISAGRPTAIAPSAQQVIAGRGQSSSGRPLPGAAPASASTPPPAAQGVIDIGPVDLANPVSNKHIADCVADTRVRVASEGIVGAIASQLAMDIKVAAFKLAKLRAWAMLRNAYLVAASETPTDLGAWKVACEDAAAVIAKIKTSDAQKLADAVRKIPQQIAEAHWNDTLINSAAFNAHWTLNTITGGYHWYATIPVQMRDVKSRAVLTTPPTPNTDADQWWLYPTAKMEPRVGADPLVSFKDSQGSTTPPFFLPSSSALPENILHFGWFFTNFLDPQYQSGTELHKVAPIIIGQIQKWLEANNIQARLPATGKILGQGLREKSKTWKSMNDQPIYAGNPAYMQSNLPLRKVSWYEEDIFPFAFANVGYWRSEMAKQSQDFTTSESLTAGKIGDSVRASVQKYRAESDAKAWKAKADKAREAIGMTLSYLAGYGQSAGGVGSYDMGQWTAGPDGLYRLTPKGLTGADLAKVFNALKLEQGLTLPWASSADAAAALPKFDEWLWTKSAKLATSAEVAWANLYDFQPVVDITEAVIDDMVAKQQVTLPAAHIVGKLTDFSPTGLIPDRFKALVDALDKVSKLAKQDPCIILPEPWATWALTRGEVEGQSEVVFVLGQFAADRAKFMAEYFAELNALTEELYGCTIPEPPADLPAGSWATWTTDKLKECQKNPTPESLFGTLKKLQATLDEAQGDCLNGSKDACALVEEVKGQLAAAQTKVASRLGAMGATRSGIAQRRGGGGGEGEGAIYSTAEQAAKKLEEIKKKAAQTVQVVPQPTPENPTPKPVDVPVGLSPEGAEKANTGAAAANGAVNQANQAGAGVVGVGAANQDTMNDTGVGQGAGGADMVDDTNAQVKANLPPEPQTGSNVGLLAIAALGAFALLRK